MKSVVMRVTLVVPDDADTEVLADLVAEAILEKVPVTALEPVRVMAEGKIDSAR